MTDSLTLLHNANIIASYDDTARYTNLLINPTTGRIVYIGTTVPDHHTAHITTRIDLNGHTIIPGLIDSHIHVQYVGKHLVSLDLNMSTSINQLQQRLQTHLTSNPPASTAQWIVGYGWEQDRLGRYPTRADLDAICTTHPIMLWRICHHIAVCNTRALELANITATTRHDGGIIDFDSTGQPTGIVRERSAEIVSDMIVDTDDVKKQHIVAGLNECVKHGLTCVQTNDGDAWQIYKQLYDAGQLPLRVFLTIMHDELNNSTDVRPTANQYYHGPNTDNDYMLNSHRVKLFGDGALGSETAALSDNYVTILHEKCGQVHNHNSGSASNEAAAGNKGVLIHAQDALTAKVKQAKDAGFRVELHVIGDAAAESGLTAFEQAGLNAMHRPILTHCQVLRADLIKRMLAINAIANVQPQFTVTDSRWISDRLPKHLLQYSYAWKTLMQSGVHVAGGSDAPIELPQPLLGMYSAVFRPYETYRGVVDAAKQKVKRDDVDEQGRWTNAECVTPSDALRMYTFEGAYCGGLEGVMGELRADYLADMTVLAFDPIKEPERMLDGKAEQVWVHGKRRI